MGIRLMIIELGNYNSAKELLIETRTTGFQIACYQDGVQRVSVTGEAVCMEEKGMGMQTGYRAHTIGLWVRNKNRHPYNHCGAIKLSIICNKIEIDEKKEGWSPQVPGRLARWPADEAAWMTCGCTSVTWHHVILEGHYISEAGEGCSEGCIGHQLAYIRIGSKGSKSVWLDPIHVHPVGVCSKGSKPAKEG